MSNPTFSMREIAAAVGREIKFLSGISYGALELSIPLSNGQHLLLREGDDEGDHEVRIVNVENLNKEHLE